MKARPVIWLCAALLTVGLGMILPELVFHIQDERLEGAVETQTIQTVDLNLMSQLTAAQTLRLARTYESSVTLERGQLMTAQEAADTATSIVTGLLNSFVSGGSIRASQAAPMLCMGQEGENVIFWEVTLTGRWINPVQDMAMASEQPVTGMALVDERSGGIVSLRLNWESAAGPAPTPMSNAMELTEMPASEPYEGEANEMPTEEPDWLYDWQMSVLASAVYYLLTNLDGTGFTWDTVYDPLDLFVTLPDGSGFPVEASWDMTQFTFND